MTRGPRAEEERVTSSRALALLAHYASAVFMAAAVTAWLVGLWPANPTTLLIACLMVLSGPVIGQLHAGAEREGREEEPDPEPAIITAPITMQEARARAFHNWRDTVNPAIEYRERERRASQWIRT
jgi:hypothetical protein